jgi:hypothetical protein
VTDPDPEHDTAQSAEKPGEAEVPGPADTTGRAETAGERVESEADIRGAVDGGAGDPAVAGDTDAHVAETHAAAAARQLATLDSLPLTEHPDVYAQLHSDLHTALAGIDDA